MYDRYKNIPDVYIGGKKYRLCDVYKYFDVGDSTVRKILQAKLRGWELVYGKGKVPLKLNKVRDRRMVENVTIEQLEIGDNIWFRRPESYSTTGIVRELHFNGGKPYVVVEVGKHNFNISNHYEIARVGANDDEMQR